MIAFLTICYCLFIWFIFFKLKLLPWNLRSQVVVAIIGVVAIFGLLVAMNLYQPYSKDLRIYRYVIQIVPRVTGRVIDVPVQRDVPVKKGDVLFKIDPRPFEYRVEKLKAALAEAEQAVGQLKAALDGAVASIAKAKAERDLAKFEFKRAVGIQKRDPGAVSALKVDQTRQQLAAADAAVTESEAAREKAQLAYESEIGGVNTTVAQIRAELKDAEYDLAETTVYAPADGFVTNLSLFPGQVASQLVANSVMSFVEERETTVIATFTQNVLRYIKPGDIAEVVLDDQPGKIFPATVDTVIWATGQGQLAPSGNLQEFTQQQPAGRFAVRLTLDGVSDLRLPAGVHGAAAIYSDKAKAIRIIRKVIIRMYTWLNYVSMA